MSESRYRRFEQQLEERHPVIFRAYVVVGVVLLWAAISVASYAVVVLVERL